MYNNNMGHIEITSVSLKFCEKKGQMSKVDLCPAQSASDAAIRIFCLQDS